MYRPIRLMAATAASIVFLSACSPQGEPPETAEASGNGNANNAATFDLAGACDEYLETFNRISAQSAEHFYKLFAAAGQADASIESERDRWLFVGGTIEEAMLADEWASLTLWHRNLQDHLRSIIVLSGEGNYDFPEDAEAAVEMTEELETAYVRCKFSRSLPREE